ncbi:flagellar hook-associated protein FlgK [Heyndrickxia camelliae]|uniref:Flagellar hook-associated protein 1 n=1 Tax=Heyndrickxia camelliae TaxID=1707093 RepID=A0A2N3LP13_9BACI|nr:flagellar hook-associated protein FlgK [Heyndrickxia camelliae]PKR86284.1 flagellar hook-associated protein FlgK [Heyndrickxia camelliae]
MTSTFFGLETAKRGMNTQQSALYVTGQNISNANTDGYSRQTVNITHTEPYPPVGMNRPQLPGQMGTGSKIADISRVRDAFLDQQYRGQNNQLGYWSTKADALSQMEQIMNEPSDDGLSATMGQLSQALQDLSVHPEDEGARSVVLNRAQAVAETFHYLSNSLSEIQDNLGNKLQVSLKDINSILKQINDLNNQIAKVEPNGYVPNDLYDDRDRLVDQLSTYVNIKVTRGPTSPSASPIAEGPYKIEILDASNKSVGTLVDSDGYYQLGFKSGEGPESDNPTEKMISGFTLEKQGNIDFDVASFSQGSLKGLVESYGYVGTNGSSGIYPDMLDKLNKLALTFAQKFNDIHSSGTDLNGNAGSNNFFIFASSGNSADYAKNIELNSSITTSMIAASSSATKEPGNGQNAIKLANFQNEDLSTNGSNMINKGTIGSFYAGVIGSLGVDAQQANRLTANSSNLKESVDQNRQSVSSVSLDEEMVNMIKFQQAYNASARNITIVDEMLDKIINGLGTGGR